MPTKAPAIKRGPGRPTQDEQNLIAAEPDRPTKHNGIMITSEEPIRHLPKAPMRVSRLYLADDTLAYACRDCLFTADTRGAILLHRNEEHGARNGMKSVKVSLPKPDGDLVLPPRGEDPAPSNPLQMTLGEFLALVPNIAALGDLLEAMERERDEALALVSHQRTNQAKIDGFDRLQEELTVAKQQLRSWGNYEAIRDELYELRRWKRDVVKRFAALGFKLDEED